MTAMERILEYCDLEREAPTLADGGCKGVWYVAAVSQLGMYIFELQILAEQQTLEWVCRLP